MNTENQLYERFRLAPFPVLGKEVGDFALYNSLLAGCADRSFRGGRIAASEVPVPDSATIERVQELRHKKILNANEQAFILYFELLEQIRLALLQRSQSP